MVSVRDPEPTLRSTLVEAERYRLLGLSLCYPDPEELRSELAAVPVELEAIASVLRPHVDAALPGEYLRLFAQSAPVSPYEGTYFVEEKGVLMGQLAALYQLFGARTGGQEHESPDHIGVEGGFAALLTLKEALCLRDEEAEPLEVTRAARRAFFEDHLGRWVEEMARRLAEETRHPFYANLGPLLVSTITNDIVSRGYQPMRKARGRGLPVVNDAEHVTCATPGGVEL